VGLVGHGGTGGKGISSRPKWMVECLSRRCQQICKTMMWRRTRSPITSLVVNEVSSFCVLLLPR